MVRKPERLRVSSYTSKLFAHVIGLIKMGCFHVTPANKIFCVFWFCLRYPLVLLWQVVGFGGRTT